MGSSKLSRCYALALLECCDEVGDHQVVARQLDGFIAAWRNHVALRTALKSPVVSEHEKAALLNKLFAKALFAPTTRHFLLVLLDNGRLGEVDAIVTDFQDLLDKRSGQLRAEVTSAVPLEKTELAALKKEAERLTGQKVVLDAKVDEAILGGVITRIGNIVLDGSVRTDLEVLREKLLA
jgi:F-type H+-transporting ATPase subunit delta